MPSYMNEIKTARDDLIEETRMRELDDEQIEWRVRKFTEVCEETIRQRVENTRKRNMLIERLQIMKCFYDHSSVKQPAAGLTAREIDESQRNKRLQNIIRRRRMALEMIERADPEVAREINNSLETLFSSVSPAGRRALPKRSASFADQGDNLPLSDQNWYFLYFNLVLMLCLIAAIVLAVR